MLARYAATYSREKKRLPGVSEPELRKTRFADPQLEWWDLDDEQWRKVVERMHLSTRSVQAADNVEQRALQIAGMLLLLLIVKPSV